MCKAKTIYLRCVKVSLRLFSQVRNIFQNASYPRSHVRAVSRFVSCHWSFWHNQRKIRIYFCTCQLTFDNVLSLKSLYVFCWCSRNFSFKDSARNCAILPRDWLYFVWNSSTWNFLPGNPPAAGLFLRRQSLILLWSLSLCFLLGS